MEDRATAVPESWRTTTLGEVVNIFTGRKDVNQTNPFGKYIFFSCSPEVFYSDEYICDDSAIIIVGNGSYTGTVRYFSGRFDLYQRTYACVLKPEIKSLFDQKFIFYYTKKYFEKSFMGGSRGSSIPYIVRGDIEDFEIPHPPLPEQKAIASVLSSLDNKIELLREQNKTLETTAQAIFKEWFVNFNFPGATGKMIDSELGEIPEGWTVHEMADLIEVKDGTHDSPKQSQKGHYLITSRHLSKSGLDFNNAYLISDKDFVSINKRSKVDSYDILISMIGTIGLLYFVLDRNIDFAIKNVGLFKTSQKKEMAEYVYLFLNSKEGLQYIQSSIAGTTQSYVSLTALRKIPIIVPQNNIVNIFNKLTQPIFSKIYKNISQIQTLSETRDALLPKLTKGEVRVEGVNN